MSKPSKVSQDASFDFVFDEFTFTAGRLKADKLTEKLVPEFEKFRPRYFSCLMNEFGFKESLQGAAALISARDDGLDEVFDIFVKALLGLCKSGFNDPLYEHYCGKKRPYEYKRPILGEQLEDMRRLGALLRHPATPPTLVTLVELVEGAVASADDAVQQREKAQQDIASFRNIGERKRLIDAFNELRWGIYEQIVALQKGDAERTLEEDYAEGFFRKQKSRSQAEGKAEARKLAEEVKQLREQLTLKEARLTEIEAEEEERKKNEAELEETMAALAESQRLAAEAQQRAETLRARLARK